MEYATACDICFNEFKENVTIPKILSCGHSFCLSCVRNLIQTKTNCTTCRKVLDANKAAEDYPTNFYVFSAKNIVKKESNDLTDVIDKSKVMKSKIQIRKNKIVTDLNNTELYLTQLESLTDADNEVIDLRTSLQVLDRLEKEFEKIELSGLSRLKESVNLRITSYENSQEFLKEIYRKLQKNEIIYTVKNVEDDVKYGKISCQGDLILFHALSEFERPDKASIIWFDDLKLCVTEDYFFPFLQLSCDEKETVRLLTVKMFNNQNASKFITLCTGECGLCYKGQYYVTQKVQDEKAKAILSIMPFDCRLFNNKNESINYNAKLINETKMNKGDIFVIFFDKDSTLHIFRNLIESGIWTGAAGKIESPLNLEDCISSKDIFKLKILDSGISFKI